MDRRGFLKSSAGLGGVVLTARWARAGEAAADWVRVAPAEPLAGATEQAATGKVAFVKTRDRAAGVRRALNLVDYEPPAGRHLFIKPNFNSHHPAPGSSHEETLKALVQVLRDEGADRITLGDRSGMGNTRGVMERKGIFALADELGFDTLVFDELEADQWVRVDVENGHWERGFAIPQAVLEADGVVQACCLKTHQYGGHFTLSLKNSVGLAAKQVPGESHNYMRELHGSPDMRRMIAELNVAYDPDVIVLDGVESFVDGGPHEGKRVESEVVLASTDRIALDAVGVALLRYYGTTPQVSEGRIFELEQIARAVELGLGVSSPSQIELITDDEPSAEYARTIRSVLLA